MCGSMEDRDTPLATQVTLEVEQEGGGAGGEEVHWGYPADLAPVAVLTVFTRKLGNSSKCILSSSTVIILTIEKHLTNYLS